MRLKNRLASMALVMLMVRVGAETIFEMVNTDDWLYVNFSGHDVTWGSLNTTIGTTDIGVWYQGDWVSWREWTTPFDVNRYVFVVNGSAGFDQTFEGSGGYGASVESNGGFGFIESYVLLTHPNAPILTNAVAGAEAGCYTVSVNALNIDPFTLVEVTQIGEDGFGNSRMLASWWPDSLFSDPEWDILTWNGSYSLQLISDYDFSLDILSLWQTPAIELIEIMEFSG